MNKIIYVNELSHYGVKGMKWGVRKSPVVIGRRRTGIQQQLSPEAVRAKRRARLKKAAIIGGVAVAAGLAIYGGYKLRSSAVTSLANRYRSYARAQMGLYRQTADMYGYFKTEADHARLRGDVIGKRANLNSAKDYLERTDRHRTNALDAYARAANDSYPRKEVYDEMANIIKRMIRR